MSRMPLRVAIPKRVMNPMIDGMLTTREVSSTASTPPMSASGSESMTIAESGTERNSP